MSEPNKIKQDRELFGTANSGRQRKAELEAAKKKKQHKIYAIVGAVIAVLVAALLFWDSGIIQRNATAMKVGDKSYTVADLDYYYYTVYNNYYNAYVSYGLIDGDTSLKKQSYSEDQSWYDYFVSTAQDYLTQVSILTSEAEAAGYTLSQDGQDTVESNLQSIKDSCTSNGITMSYYLNYYYGSFMTEKAFIQNMTNTLLANEYADYITNGFDPTDAEIQAKYDEDPSAYDTFEYDAYFFKGTADSTTDEDGNTVEPTDEENQAAMDKAKTGADAMLAALESGESDLAAIADEYGATSYSNSTYFSSYDYGEWLTSAKAGDSTIVESDNGYYVVRLNNRYLDDYALANVRHILIKAETDDGADTPTEAQMEAAKTKAEDILSQWKAGDATEDSFAALADEYSDDSAEGGLYTDVTKGRMVQEFNDWLFADGRKAGDTDVISDSTYNGYHVMYFVGYNDEPYWKEQIRTTLQSDSYDEWYEGLTASYPVSEGFGIGSVGV